MFLLLLFFLIILPFPLSTTEAHVFTYAIDECSWTKQNTGLILDLTDKWLSESEGQKILFHVSLSSSLIVALIIILVHASALQC